uniref:LysM domain-containing protein n=1 Tax=Ganoderma boninense TaxID=34458 RepID=A0A5K1K049_9APHY|nr:LysM domain-containing protein [Ganoderma boninense]
MQAPSRFPGSTIETTAALQDRLMDNHVKWHIFFNKKRFHNHTAHQLLAIYQLGANGPLIDAAYKEEASYQRKQYDSPGSITEENFHEHLGDEDYYRAYLKFFTDVIMEKGPAGTLEKYIFSPKFNIEPPRPDAAPMCMTNRFLSGLLHPLIQTGYGAEFGLAGMFAEGLAETAVHRKMAGSLTPSSLWEYAEAAASDAAKATVSRIASFLPSLMLDPFRHTPQPPAQKQTNVHALSLVSRILNDDYYSYKTIGLPPPEKSEDDTSLERVLHLRGEALTKMMEEWTVDGTNAQEVESKIEELFWMNAVIFGVAGYWGRKEMKNGRFNGDFFYLHLVTSALFLPSLVAYLSPTSTTILLRTYLLNTLALYVARGRPPLPIADFYSDVTPNPAAPAHVSKKPAEGTLAPEKLAANPWLALLQSTIMHPDNHVGKLQRALSHFSALYGTTPRGHFRDMGVELKGAECLDGSLFVRTAGLALDRVGWMREGEERRGWDFDGFYHN